MKTVQLRDNMPAPKADECEGAIEELIAEFGLRCVLAAVIKSELGDSMKKVGSQATLRVCHVILSGIVNGQDPRLEAEVMALGAGYFLNDSATMTRVAGKYGFSKQALSKRVIAFCDEAGLPPSAFMRSEADRATYALTNHPKQGQNT